VLGAALRLRKRIATGRELRAQNSPAEPSTLTRILEREQRPMSSLATRMRLTQGSRLKAEKAATEVALEGVGWTFTRSYERRGTA
jgi:hypothetical protein